MMKLVNKNLLVQVALVAIVVVLAGLILPWRLVEWGTVALKPAGTMTVIGEASMQAENQRARFTAGVTVINDNKEVAIKEVNEKVAALIKAVKEFGIPDESIKTQNLSVYQMEEPVEIGGRTRSQVGQWRVSNDIEITLDDIDRASELAEVLMRSGATNVYGPNFSLEDDQEVAGRLLGQAIEKAGEKARQMAEGQKMKVGKIVSVTEEGADGPGLLELDKSTGRGGGAGVPVESGSIKVTKRVSVTFELR